MTSISGQGGIETPTPYDQNKDASNVSENENIEKLPEVRETAESVERATLKPEEKVEIERPVEESENLESALSEAMDGLSVELDQSRDRSSTGSTFSEIAADDLESAQEETGDRVEAAQRPVTSSQEVPQTAESAAPRAEDLAEAAVGSSEPKVEMADESAPPSREAAEAAARTAPEVSLDGKGGDQDGVVMVGPDGQPVGSTFDDGQGGMEQAGDIRQPGADGGMADPLKDANRTEAGGQMGLVDAEGIDPIEGAGVPDIMGGRDGMGPGDLEGGPDIGLNQQGELDGLRDAAAFGADSRVGWTGITSMSDTMSSDGSQTITSSEHYDMDDGSSMDVTTTHEDGVTTETITHTDADGNTTTETSTTGNDDGSKSESGNNNDGNSGGGGQRTRPTNDIRDGIPEDPSARFTDGQISYDPEGDTGTTPTNDDQVEAYLRQSGMPHQSPMQTDLSSSMSQPADDEGDYRPPPIEFDQSSQVDPYAQYTGEETSGGGVIGDLDPDGTLVDPSGGITGGETGDPPPTTEGGPGVNPNLPGTGPSAGGDDSVVVDSVAEIARRPDTDEETATQEFDLASGIRGEDDDPEADLTHDWSLPGQEGESGTAGEGTEFPPEPQLEDYQTGVDQDGNPIYDQDAYNEAMAAWQSKTWDIAINSGADLPWLTEISDLGEGRISEHYAETWIKVSDAKQTIQSEIANWPEHGEHSFTVLIPKKLNGNLYTDVYQTITSMDEAQAALGTWTSDELKNLQDEWEKWVKQQ